MVNGVISREDKDVLLSIYKKYGIALTVFLKKLKYGLFMRKKTLIWTVLRLKC